MTSLFVGVRANLSESVKRAGLSILFLLLFSLLCLEVTTVRAGECSEKAAHVFDQPLIDFHSHFQGDSLESSELPDIMRDNNIEIMCLSGLPGGDGDRWVAPSAWENPEWVRPFLMNFDPEANESVLYVHNQLNTGCFQGVGELFINGHGRRVHGDNPVLMSIYRLAADARVPVLFHWTLGSTEAKEQGTKADFQALKRVLSLNPDVIFVLAHCALGPSPRRRDYDRILDYLLTKFSNLYTDISGIHKELFDKDGSISQLGIMLAELIEKHPSRFLLGFDLSDSRFRPEECDATIRIYRKFLMFLGTRNAELVARKNALMILGRCRDPFLDGGKKPLFIRWEKGFIPWD
ncbi:MAG: amidohydrolase family protein [Candidatus Riflebacteria bacterium]|nr:amidohydrolase family protein [Candidatus Riflebacteria bacterium]